MIARVWPRMFSSPNEVTLVAAIILAAVMTVAPDFREIYGEASSAFALKLIIFPLLIRAVGVFSSIIGTWAVRAKEDGLADPMRPSPSGTGRPPWYL